MKQTQDLTHVTHVNGWVPAFARVTYVHKLKLTFGSLIEFIRSNLPFSLTHVSGARVVRRRRQRQTMTPYA